SLALEPLREHRVLAIGIHPDDGAEHARGSDQPALGVERAAVRITDLQHRLYAPIGIDAGEPVLFLITDVEKSFWVPNRPLCAPETASDLFELCIVRDQVPELGGFGLELEVAWGRGLGRKWRGLRGGRGGLRWGRCLQCWRGGLRRTRWQRRRYQRERHDR